MFQNLAAELQARQWGVKVKSSDGRMVDTGVQELAETLITMFRALSEQPLELTQPLVLNNYANQPAIQINQLGGSAQAMSAAMPDGSYASFGIGLGSQGIVASEFVPNLNWAISPDTVYQLQNAGGWPNTEFAGPPDPSLSVLLDGQVVTGNVDEMRAMLDAIEWGGWTDSPFAGVSVAGLGGLGPLPTNTVGGAAGQGSGYVGHGGFPGPQAGTQTGSGGGLGSGGITPTGDAGGAGSGGGGTRGIIKGPLYGRGQEHPDVKPPFPGGLAEAIASFSQVSSGLWSFRWRGETFYIEGTASGGGATPANGFSGTKTVVTEVTFDGEACELTVTDETWTFVNGRLQT